jgi:hypothetical protein
VSQRRALVFNTTLQRDDRAQVRHAVAADRPSRTEQVTEAYADLHLGATTRSPGHLGYSSNIDAPRARAIHAGRCG